MNTKEKSVERARDTLNAAYADPLDVVAVLELARSDASASRNFEWSDRLAASKKAVQALVDAASELLKEENQRHGEFAHDFEKGVKACDRCQLAKKLRLALLQVQP